MVVTVPLQEEGWETIARVRILPLVPLLLLWVAPAPSDRQRLSWVAASYSASCVLWLLRVGAVPLTFPWLCALPVCGSWVVRIRQKENSSLRCLPLWRVALDLSHKLSNGLIELTFFFQ